MEGGCSVPLGVKTFIDEEGRLVLKGRVTSVDGTRVIEEQEEGVVGGGLNREASVDVALDIGKRLGAVMIERGARELIAQSFERPE